MRDPHWTSTDGYFEGLLHPSDEALEAALADSRAAGMPDHHVAPNQGKFLHLLARTIGAKRILEIGTLGGYSTIWLARAVPRDGRVVTIEYEPLHAEVADRNIARAGVLDRVDLRVGAALDILPTLIAGDEPPFDLVFIDADKPNNPHYLTWALKLVRPGSLIIADNVVRGGAVADATSTDPNVIGIRQFLEQLSTEPRLDATVLQTVGSKGHDGFAMALVIG